jgi:parallel beta-helix repeat protein
MKGMGARRLGLAAFSFLFLGTGVGQARADSTEVTVCGQVLAEPGDYHLAGDLGPCAGHGVVIAASDVRLTLGGHTLSGVSTQSGPANRVDTSRISGSDDGVVLCAAEEAVLEANEIFGNHRYAVVLSCFDGANRNQVVRNLLHDNGLPTGDGGGVAIFYGNDNLIAGNAITGNWDGIWLPTTTGTYVQDNTVNGNRHTGIAVDDLSTGNFLLDNTAYGNGAADLIGGAGPNTCSGNLVGTTTGC